MYSFKAPVKKTVNPKSAPKFDLDDPSNPWEDVMSVEYLKQHEWVTLVDWLYSPIRIKQGRVVKTFAGKGYVHEFTDPDGMSEGHWKESPWVEIRFGPNNVERINYTPSKIQGLYRYDKSIQDEYEAEMTRMHGHYTKMTPQKEAELDRRIQAEHEEYMAKIYNLSTPKSRSGGGAGGEI